MQVDRALQQVTEQVRAFLEQHWTLWHDAWGPPLPDPLSRWTCIRSAAFLAVVLKDNGLPARTASGRSTSEGFPDQGYGFRTPDGWQDHAWVLCADHILDVTADQFGEPRVLITGKRDARYRSGIDALTTLRLTP